MPACFLGAPHSHRADAGIAAAVGWPARLRREQVDLTLEQPSDATAAY